MCSKVVRKNQSGLTMISILVGLVATMAVGSAMSNLSVFGLKAMHGHAFSQDVTNLAEDLRQMLGKPLNCSCIFSTRAPGSEIKVDVSAPEGKVSLPDIYHYDESCNQGSVIAQNGSPLPGTQKNLVSLEIVDVQRLSADLRLMDLRLLVENYSKNFSGAPLIQKRIRFAAGVSLSGGVATLNGCADPEQKIASERTRMRKHGTGERIEIESMSGSDVTVLFNNGTFGTNSSTKIVWMWGLPGATSSESTADANSTWYYLYLCPDSGNRIKPVASQREPDIGGPGDCNGVYQYVGAFYNNSLNKIEPFYQVSDSKFLLETEYIEDSRGVPGSQIHDSNIVTDLVPRTALSGIYSLYLERDESITTPGSPVVEQRLTLGLTPPPTPPAAPWNAINYVSSAHERKALHGVEIPVVKTGGNPVVTLNLSSHRWVSSVLATAGWIDQYLQK